MLTRTRTERTKDRGRIATFTLLDPELESTEHGDTYRPALEINTHHDKDRKMLVTSVNRLTRSDYMIRMVIELGRDNQCPVSPYISVPCARYSVKALDARHTEIMAQMEDHLEGLLEWAAGAKH